MPRVDLEDRLGSTFDAPRGAEQAFELAIRPLNRLGGWYSYRASKAALNQVIRTLAVELKRTHPDAIALALYPGTVATTLSRPFRSDETHAGLFVPDDAASNLLKVLDLAAVEQSDALLAWD